MTLSDLESRAERLRTTLWIIEANATFGIDPSLRDRWRELSDERGELLEQIHAMRDARMDAAE